ncbi:MAG: MOSC domain-containing protein [Thiohalocapsa sp.]
MATISDIYRYPVKGLSPERLQRVALAPGECLPHDRRFAIALASTRFDPADPRWLAKTHFVMLMRDEKLARLQTRFDAATGDLTIACRGDGNDVSHPVLQASLNDPQGRRAVAEFVGNFLGPAVARPLRVVEAPGHAFADARRKPNATSDKYVSLINHASIAALTVAIGASAGQSIATGIDPLRFRANVYFAGAPAWSELDWLGHEIALGGARLRVVSAITRCAATAVNLRTAERDLDVVGELQRHFGHNLMGIYAEVIAGGDVAAGDELVPPPSS